MNTATLSPASPPTLSGDAGAACFRTAAGGTESFQQLGGIAAAIVGRMRIVKDPAPPTARELKAWRREALR